jgi:hypothetical protein
MQSFTFTVGAAHRREFIIHLDELGLPYKEHRTLFDSTVVVQTFTVDQEDAYHRFVLDVSNFVLRLNAAKQQRKLRELEALRDEQLKKLSRKNLFRKLTFRKPLNPRDTPLIK